MSTLRYVRKTLTACIQLQIIFSIPLMSNLGFENITKIYSF